MNLISYRIFIKVSLYNYKHAKYSGGYNALSLIPPPFPGILLWEKPNQSPQKNRFSYDFFSKTPPPPPNVNYVNHSFI